MYRFVILLIAGIFLNPAYAQRTVVTRSNYYNPYNEAAYWGGDYVPRYYRYGRQTSSQFPDISDLEKYALNKNFCRENDLKRLERLELQAFGAIQNGDINTRYANVRNAILTRPKQNYKTTLLRNLSDYFGGQITGFTPMVSPYSDDYDNNYGNSTSSFYTTPFGSRIRNNNYGISSGAGVHILD